MAGRGRNQGSSGASPSLATAFERPRASRHAPDSDSIVNERRGPRPARELWRGPPNKPAGAWRRAGQWLPFYVMFVKGRLAEIVCGTLSSLANGGGQPRGSHGSPRRGGVSTADFISRMDSDRHGF